MYFFKFLKNKAFSSFFFSLLSLNQKSLMLNCSASSFLIQFSLQTSDCIQNLIYQRLLQLQSMQPVYMVHKNRRIIRFIKET